MSNNESDYVLSDSSETDMDVDFVDISADSNMEGENYLNYILMFFGLFKK